MIFKKIRIGNTLSNKNAISYISKFSFWTGFIIKTNCISNLLTHCCSSLITNSICHTYCCHSSRLCNNNIYFIDRRLFSCLILLNIFLIWFDSLTDERWIHHILWQLCWFTWTSITCDYKKIIWSNCRYNLISILVDGKWFFELTYWYLIHL